MNQRSDIDRLLRHWMDDGPSTMPDRVVEVVADRISVQRQRRYWRPLRRLPMSPIVKFGAAAAAVLVIAVVGWNLLPGRGGTGSPDVTPTVTPSPSATAAPKAVFPDWHGEPNCDPNCAGILSAGTHTSRYLDPALTYTVPTGWVNSGDWPQFYSLFPDTPSNEAEFARSRDAAQSINIATEIDTGWADDWGICPGTVDHGVVTTADDVVGALAASPNLVTTEPVQVKIGGLDGYQIDVRLDPGWTGTCPLDPEDPPTKDFTDIRHRLFVLDRSGGNPFASILVVSLQSSKFEAFAAEVAPIVDSFTFDLGPAAT